MRKHLDDLKARHQQRLPQSEQHDQREESDWSGKVI